MAVFKCKMCGGTIEFEQGATVGVCDSCGTRQTLPKLDDDQRANLYGRANHFRRNSDYDKAMGIYEQILNEDKTDAEAYWSIVLCRYGIEYVEDPKTHKRIPTVNRAQYTSIFADADYQSALQYADTMQKSIYEAEAKAIDDIQKGILAISQKEEPFDVFICYKETDEAGKRTPDSVLANDLYHQLVQEGFKVFFSRITLEDKLGSEYEPYIFAALNSAKVMVVLGTKPEYFNAVWVKNEWSRYLTLVKASDGQKMLIPAYKDMDPYDLPDAFSNLQAQDMSKLGFMQDLIRGIRKIVHADEPKPVKETVVVQNTAPTSSNYSGLLKRAYIFLEDGKWAEADEYCEKVLDADPECAEAYLGKLLAALHISKHEDLRNAAEPFDGNDNCKKASRYDAKLAKELADANAYIRERNETAQKEKTYQKAITESQKWTEEGYAKATVLYTSIFGYKDAKKRADECRKKAVEARNEAIYKTANAYKTNAKIADVEIALQKFESILDYKDARTKADECRKKIEELKNKQEQEEAERRRQEEEKRQREAEAAEARRIAAEKRKKLIKKAAIIGTPIVAVVIVFLIVLNSIIIPGGKYKKAVALADAGEYEQALAAFEALGNYKDASDKSQDVRNSIEADKLEKDYVVAVQNQNEGKYETALQAFKKLGDYKDSAERVEVCKEKQSEQHYVAALTFEKEGDYLHALQEYGQAIAYKDARKKITRLRRGMTGLLTAGTYNTVGLKKNGTVVAVGFNEHGQCNVDNWTEITMVSAGWGQTVGLKRDGTVIANSILNKDGDVGQAKVDNWKDIVEIAAGDSHTVGLRSNGTVIATQITVYRHDYGQCAVSGWKNIISIAAGNCHTVGLCADGTVVATGNTESDKCDVDKWTDIVAIAAGQWHTVGLKSDGTVVATGDNGAGQCRVEDWKDIVAIAAGAYHTVGLKSDGTVIATKLVGDGSYSTGELDVGQFDVDDWTNIVAVSAGAYHTVGLKADGTVIATGYDDDNRCDVDDWKDMKLPSVN